MGDAILSQLQAAAKGLTYPSEQDYPIKAFLWAQDEVGTGPLDADAVKKQAKAPVGAPVETQPVEDFFAPITTPQSWHTTEEQAAVQQGQKLAQTLKQHLTGLTVYRIGDTDTIVFAVGKTSEGEHAGVTTRVVET